MNLKPIYIFYEEKGIPKVCSLTTKSLLRTTKNLLKSDKTEAKILLGSESIIMKRKEKGDHDEIVRCPGEQDARVTAYSRTANDAINTAQRDRPSSQKMPNCTEVSSRQYGERLSFLTQPGSRRFQNML